VGDMNIYETYRQSEILEADPIRLIDLLYRGALDAVRDARTCLRAGDIAARGNAVSKASGIVIELATSLDHERGGDFSRNLAELYVYMLGRLTEAHTSQKEEPLTEVENLLATLLEAWASLTPAEPEVPAELYASAGVETEHFSCSF
jgi:flagellar protein FliS